MENYIRVNPGKCKVMYSELAAATKAHYFGHSLIAEVTTLKYLGYWLGRTGRHENDKHLIAQDMTTCEMRMIEL